MCNKLWHGIESISNSHSASSQLSGEFTLFDSYTRKLGFERDSASPVTNLTARHCKKYIQYSEFTASASCSQTLNVKSTLNTVRIFRANSVFHCKRRVAQKSWMVRNIFNTVKISGKALFFRQAQVAQKSWTVKIFSIQYIQCIVTWDDPRNLGKCSVSSGLKSWLVIMTLNWTKSSFFECQVFRAFFRTLLLSVAALPLTSNFSWLAEVEKFWSQLRECSV